MLVNLYAEKQYKKFDKLTLMACSPNQVERIKARLALWEMKDQVGKEVYDAMWDRVRRKDEERKEKLRNKRKD